MKGHLLVFVIEIFGIHPGDNRQQTFERIFRAFKGIIHLIVVGIHLNHPSKLMAKVVHFGFVVFEGKLVDSFHWMLITASTSAFVSQKFQATIAVLTESATVCVKIKLVPGEVSASCA